MTGIRHEKQRCSNLSHCLNMTASLALSVLAACSPHTGENNQSSMDQQQEIAPQSTAVSGEVPPEFIEQIITAASEEENLETDAIKIIRAESVIWRDGSLGCPKPGQMYTMAHVEGYWVVLEVGDRQFDYRVTSSGQFLRCKNLFYMQNPVG